MVRIVIHVIRSGKSLNGVKSEIDFSETSSELPASKICSEYVSDGQSDRHTGTIDMVIVGKCHEVHWSGLMVFNLLD